MCLGYACLCDLKKFFLDVTNSKEKKNPQEELSFVSVSGPLSIFCP